MSFVMRCIDEDDAPVWLEVPKCCLSDSMFKLLVERVTILDCEVWGLNDRLFVRAKFGDKLLATRELFGVVVCPTIPIHPQSLLTAAVDHLMTSWSRCRRLG